MYLPQNVIINILEFLLPQIPSRHKFKMKYVLDELIEKSEKYQEHDISIYYPRWWFRPREPVGMMMRPKIWGDGHIRFCLVCGEYKSSDHKTFVVYNKCNCKEITCSYERWNDIIKFG